MMDFLTRFAWTVPLPNQQAATLARAMINIFLQTGFPAELISDAGTHLVSNIVAEMCRLLEITKYTVQPLNQKSKRSSRTIYGYPCEQFDAVYICKPRWLVWIFTICHICVQFSGTAISGRLHFFLIYHRDPRIPLDNLLAHRVSTYVEDIKPHDSFAMNFQIAWQNARDNLQQQQLRQKQQYD